MSLCILLLMTVTWCQRQQLLVKYNHLMLVVKANQSLWTQDVKMLSQQKKMCLQKNTLCQAQK